MTRRLSVLLVLAFFVMSFSSLAIAAKAKVAENNSSSYSEQMSAKQLLNRTNDDGAGIAASGKPASQPASLGYYMTLGTQQVGISELDLQAWNSEYRQVVIGSDNKIHTIWTFQDGYVASGVGGDRYAYYNGYNAGSTPSNPNGGPMPDIGSGWGTIGVGPAGGLAYAAYRYGIRAPAGHGPYDPRWRTAIGKQTSEFSPIFSMSAYPTADTFMTKILNCQGIKTGMDTCEGGYTFPAIATDVNGTGQTIVHAFTWENPRPAVAGGLGGDTTGVASLVYYRTLGDAVHPGTTCGTFIDSTDQGLNYDIVASPTNDDVAVVYMQPQRWTGYLQMQYSWDENILYRVSHDQGTTWQPADTIYKLTNADNDTAAGGTIMYARAQELSALYDNTGCLHVLYTLGWKQYDPMTYMPFMAQLNHWSKCPTACTVVLKYNRRNQPGYYFPSGTYAILPPGMETFLSKPTLTQCTVGSGPNAGTRLYAVYTQYCDSTGLAAPYNVHADRSAAPNTIMNGDVVVQGSTDLTGQSWGVPVNITNTRSNGCVAGACASEQFANSAIYTNDSMRIQYMLDLDAGFAYRWNGNGDFTSNPMVIKTHQCFAVPSEAILSANPDSIVWPLHTIPGGTQAVPVLLTNSGTTNAVYTRTVNYLSGSNWLTFVNPANSTVPSGCTTTQGEVFTAHGPATEGYYRATVTYSYTGSKTLTIPVELYNYAASNWFMEENASIHTSYVSMVVNQTSRVGVKKGGFRYFSDLGETMADTAYLYDGSLLIGTSNTTLSIGAFADSAGAGGHVDALVGRLFGTSVTTYDTLPALGQPYGYRHAYGTGCNKDSTIGFDADFYAPRHIDSANFIIGKFSLYAGPKNPTATINNVTVAYAADWDVPDDSSDNRGGFDSTLHMLYQRGAHDDDTTRFGAMSGWRDDGARIDGGKILSNVHWVYRQQGYVHDTIWTLIQGTSTYDFGPGYVVTGPPLDTIADLNQLLVFSKTATIKPKATGVFTVYLIFAGQAGPRQPGFTGSLVNLKAEIAKAKAFICKYIAPVGSPFCASCTDCGNANGDGAINISDAVYLIAYIFAHGTAPGDCNYALGRGDANGDGVVNISDAVYLIAYIFAHGTAPHCQGM
jgi:hypothetical protein